MTHNVSREPCRAAASINDSFPYEAMGLSEHHYHFSIKRVSRFVLLCVRASIFGSDYTYGLVITNLTSYY
ncbi:MAG: hypothetical protein ABSA44_04280 [Bacteroidota bacterium]